MIYLDIEMKLRENTRHVSLLLTKVRLCVFFFFFSTEDNSTSHWSILRDQSDLVESPSLEQTLVTSSSSSSSFVIISMTSGGAPNSGLFGGKSKLIAVIGDEVNRTNESTCSIESLLLGHRHGLPSRWDRRIECQNTQTELSHR